MADDEWRYDAEEFEEGEGARTADERTDESGRGEHSDADDSWRFSLADLEGAENERGWALSSEITAGSPKLENVFFVGLGIALALLVVWQLFV